MSTETNQPNKPLHATAQSRAVNGDVGTTIMTITTNKRGFSFWALQIPGWLLLIYLIYAQGITAFNYDLGVTMGTQEPAETVTEVGTAFWYGFALGDLLTYIPILVVGLVGHLRAVQWWRIAMAAALGITVYWPIVCLTAMVDARNAAGWNLSNEAPYWIVLTLIAAWGIWGLIVVARKFQPNASLDRVGSGATVEDK